MIDVRMIKLIMEFIFVNTGLHFIIKGEHVIKVYTNLHGKYNVAANVTGSVDVPSSLFVIINMYVLFGP